MSRARELFADVIVGIAVVLVALWLFRQVVGLVVWLTSFLVLAVVVVALLVFARRMRRG